MARACGCPLGPCSDRDTSCSNYTPERHDYNKLDLYAPRSGAAMPRSQIIWSWLSRPAKGKVASNCAPRIQKILSNQRGVKRVLLGGSILLTRQAGTEAPSATLCFIFTRRYVCLCLLRSAALALKDEVRNLIPDGPSFSGPQCSATCSKISTTPGITRTDAVPSAMLIWVTFRRLDHPQVALLHDTGWP